MDIKEQNEFKEQIANGILRFGRITEPHQCLEAAGMLVDEVIEPYLEQAGYLPIQADEKGLVTDESISNAVFEWRKLHNDAPITFDEHQELICTLQKAIDDKEKEDKDEKYNKLADDNFGKVTGDLFRELANPIFRYEFLKETQQINGEILSSKLAIAKKEKEEVVKKVFDLADRIFEFAWHGDYSNGIEAYGIDEGNIRADECLKGFEKEIKDLKQTLEELK